MSTPETEREIRKYMQEKCTELIRLTPPQPFPDAPDGTRMRYILTDKSGAQEYVASGRGRYLRFYERLYERLSVCVRRVLRRLP